MKVLVYAMIVVCAAILGILSGQQIKKHQYHERCMKYFGSKGYPADGYCKLFIGEIKARDE